MNLPAWEDIDAKKPEDRNQLEDFIYEYEPAYDTKGGDTEFRLRLECALNWFALQSQNEGSK